MPSITQTCNGLATKRDARHVKALFDAALTDMTAIITALGTALINSGALAIKTGGSALVKTAATIYYKIAGVVYSKAAADMAALSGTVTNAKFNVYVFYVDAAGTLTSAMGTEAATLVAVVFPTLPANKATIGYVIINPTGTGSFVGGTTALDDGTVVPNAVYVNTVGSLNLLPTLTLTA